ncbi:M48 family metallopeptidase [Alistipes sp. ZOR0009]|uniref:M48 family metallopeptidase n=1 Tax=Alistipes sp. ZOR0009 TaxID=1339253 RepID=UPI0009DE3FBC|nr:M48 family metallopeptidase [Alistipes sp. ZOR0009]
MPSKIYEGVLIHPDLPSGRCGGEISVSSFAITFTSGATRHAISLSELQISAGGAGNRFLFFTTNRESDISIYTADRSILKEPVLASNTRLESQIKSSSKVLRKLAIASMVVVAVVGLGILGLALSKDRIVRGIANQIPVSWEEKASDQLFGTLTAGREMVKNDSLKRVFERAAQPLLSEVRRKGFKIDLYFVKDGTINAFALPGGKVVIQTGLVENAQSWEEVMGVLAHELAHVTNRHHVRGVIDNVGLFALLSAMFGDVSALAGTFANMGGELASLANSRSFEYEADADGWNYLVAAKINPRGMISFFETLQKRQTTLEKLPLSIMSTHPDTKSRIETLKKMGQELKAPFTPIAGSFADFKRALNR